MIIKLRDYRLLANFNDSGEMSSGPEDLPDSSSLINLAISIIILLTYNLDCLYLSMRRDCYISYNSVVSQCNVLREFSSHH